MSNTEVTQDLARIPQQNFQARTSLSTPGLKKAFGYALNSIRNGWKLEGNPTLRPTTEALLKEADVLTTSDSKLRGDYTTASQINDPRIKYQVALELNRELGDKLSEQILQLESSKAVFPYKSLRDLGFVDMLDAGLIYRGSDQARMVIEPGFKPTPLSRLNTSSCQLRMISPDGDFAIGYCDVDGASTPIVAMLPERPKKKK